MHVFILKVGIRLCSCMTIFLKILKDNEKKKERTKTVITS